MNVSGLRLALRFAVRELRGGLYGFVVFIICLALGVAAISAVGGITRGLNLGLANEGRAILGGDLSFSLVHRSLDSAEKSYLENLGEVSRIGTMRAMARTEDNASGVLVELKAVAPNYPLVGTFRLKPEGEALLEGTDALHQRLQKDALQDIFGAVVEPGLLGQIEAQVGDTLILGKTRLRVSGVIEDEPDRLAGGIGVGPRLLISHAALAASGLVQPGSLVRWHHRVKIAPQPDEANLKTLIEGTKARFPQAGWRIRSRANASPGLAENIERFAQFLTLVGLTALLIGGVGVANGVRALVARKRSSIATLKCVGAEGRLCVAIYLLQVMMIAGLAVIIGLVIGAFVPFVAAYFLSGLIPLEVTAGLSPGAWGLAALYGLLTAFAFSLLPLGLAHDIPVSALFRGDVGTRRRRPRLFYVAVAIASLVLLAIVAIVAAYDRRIAIYYVIGACATFIVLRLAAGAIMAIARRLPQVRHPSLRMALTNLHRPGALTVSVVISLGLGLTLLVSLAMVENSLRTMLSGVLPRTAPSFYFVDIQNDALDEVLDKLGQLAPDATLQTVPMLRGRITKLKGVDTATLTPPPDARWVLQGDRGLTYADTVPENSVLKEGTWWGPDHDGEPLVSFEAELAGLLDLKIGDTVTTNVFGREVTARIANLRAVEWESLSINFVLVYSANTFRDAPHAHIATLRLNDPEDTAAAAGIEAREFAILRAVNESFPTVTSIRVKDALKAIDRVLGQLISAIRAAGAVALLSGFLVLGGALAASHANRIYDSVVLKTLGASRAWLISAYGIEYMLLGLVTAVFAVAAGAIAAYLIITRIFDMTFQFSPILAVATAVFAVISTLLLGLVGTYRVLRFKPAAMLRNAS